VKDDESEYGQEDSPEPQIKESPKTKKKLKR
jgi:hypothetical protein